MVAFISHLHISPQLSCVSSLPPRVSGVPAGGLWGGSTPRSPQVGGVSPPAGRGLKGLPTPGTEVAIEKNVFVVGCRYLLTLLQRTFNFILKILGSAEQNKMVKYDGRPLMGKNP